MMKKKMKFVFALFAAAVMMLNIVSCGKGEENQKNEQQKEFQTGKAEGTSFINEWADYKITFPEWAEFSEDEFLRDQEEQIVGANPDLKGFAYDFAVQVDGDMYEATFEDALEGSTLDTYVKEMEDSLSEAGYEVEESKTVELGGYEYAMIHTTISFQEMNISYDYYIRQIDGKYMCLTVFYNEEDKEAVNEILSGMEKCRS